MTTSIRTNETNDSLSLDNRNRLDYCFVKWLGDWSVSLILRHFAV